MRLAFLTGVTRRIYGGTILTEPMGGTHSALLNLAGSLADLGHQVTVFCNCQDNEGFFNGVEYLLTGKIARFARENEIDVLIYVASEAVMKAKIRAKKTILWLHNDYSPYWNNELPDIAAKISDYMVVRADKVVTVSQWQTDIIKGLFKVPESHIEIKRIGVNLNLFAKRQETRKKHLVYTSAPDRGLDLLLDFFPEIKKVIPELELHIFSSFNTWGKAEPELMEIEQAIFVKAQQEGVFVHKPLPVSLLATELLNSYLWVYPNHPAPETYFFAETFCVSALEAQAAGLPVITSNRGALPEIVLNGETGILIDGEPYSPAFRAAFIKAVINLLEDKNLRMQYSQNAAEWAKKFCWPDLAKQWQDFLVNLLNEKVSTKLDTTPLIASFLPPKVSVIIPTYNRAANLVHVMEALTRQNFKEFEVIIADDGSTDNTREVLDSFRSRLNIRYAWCGKNKGFRAARTRNTGLRKARGELIVFLDSDVVVPVTFLEEHLKAHRKYDKILVNSYVYRMKDYSAEDLGLSPDEFVVKQAPNLSPDTKDRYNLFDRGEPVDQGYFLDSNSLSVKAEHIRNEGFDPQFTGWGFEDVELGYRFSRKGFKFFFIRDNCISYHIHHNSTSEKVNESNHNWQRIAAKYRLKSWYKPLTGIKVRGLVKLNGLDLHRVNKLTDMAEAEFELKIGDSFSGYLPCFTFEITDGIINF